MRRPNGYDAAWSQAGPAFALDIGDLRPLQGKKA